jgi:toxin YoeB
MYEIELLPDAKKDCQYWVQNNPGQMKKIKELLEAIALDPYSGIGKPEQLKHGKRGYWSRRITKGHRILYEILATCILIHRCKGHYSG